MVSCNVARSSPGGQQLATLATVSRFGGWPAHVLFRWVNATMHLKAMRQMREAKKAFASIMDLYAETIQRIKITKKRQLRNYPQSQDKVGHGLEPSVSMLLANVAVR